MDHAPLQPISLGPACDVKYQLSRNVFFRAFPDRTETEFRNMLFRWLGQPTVFKRHVFDWAITPYDAVRAYLEADFQGVFEREDLFVGEDGVVRHRRLKTAHPHDFHKRADGGFDEADLDAQYPAARSKFDYLAERFRAHLTSEGDHLYVMGDIRPLAETRRLIELLGARSPDHRFRLLLVGRAGAVDQILGDLGEQVSKGWLPAGGGKPDERLWEGDDRSWDAVLDAFPLELPDAPPAKPWRPPEAGTGADRAEAVAPVPPRKGWTVLTRGEGPPGDGVFDFAGSPQAVVRGGDVAAFAGAGHEDHYFSQLASIPDQDRRGWCKVEVRWPDGPRAVLTLQNQDCRSVALGSADERGGAQTLLARLPAEATRLRIVLTPDAEGGGVLPRALTLATAKAGPPSLLDRIAARFRGPR